MADAAYGSQSARATRWPPMSMPNAYAAPDAADISPRRPVRRSASYLQGCEPRQKNCGAELRRIAPEYCAPHLNVSATAARSETM